MAGKRRASNPKASSWDKISARDAGDTLANRDVYEDQQLDRGQKLRKRSNRGGYIVAAIVGVLVTIAAWIVFSTLAAAVIAVGAGLGSLGGGGDVGVYYTENTRATADGGAEVCYQPVDENGAMIIDAECYTDADDVPVPEWYSQAQAEAEAAEEEDAPASSSVGEQLGRVSMVKLFFTVGPGLIVGLIIGGWFNRQTAKFNARVDHTDINDHRGDQHIALPEEVQRKFDWFPDAGAHSAVQVSSMISHMMLKQKGLKKVEMVQRASEDTYDKKTGDLIYYKGEAIEDENGDDVTSTVPLIDEAFGDDLFEASGLLNKGLRKTWDTTKIPYNADGRDRDKLGKYKTVADLINDDWELPEYEVQRPGGAYIVDTAPVNTMVLAITRAGKGQTYIEPMIDAWSREKKPSNMVINDPKGELLVNNYVPLVKRGFQPVQFNLINTLKTDIYNPLGLAAESAREGDSTKTAMYVENIAEVFFPTDGGEDPMWNNAANNAFKRAAYGLIDYYLEEERALREYAAKVGMDPETLTQKLDVMWGKVTLYNCYQMFVQLSSKKVKNPAKALEKRIKAGEFEEDDEARQAEEEKVAEQEFLWEGKDEMDMLTLFFNATEALPTNTMRTLIGNANNALRAMAGAEKMLASVYGIAITAMSFFTDPTISTLTSGRPSQNTDLGGLSFPRRFGVRFAPNYLKRDHLVGQQAVWSAYSDPMFTQSMGKDFEHEDSIGREGWARYYFKGIFPTDEAWIKLELRNPQTKMLVRTFYFHFKKSYQLSLNGRHYVIEPVMGKKLVRDGVLRELKPVFVDESETKVKEYRPGDTVFPQERLQLDTAGAGMLADKVRTTVRAITQTTVRYSESPKAVFLVTPPHLMKYAKLILILVKQLVDLNFDKSYMTKSNQKPLFRTRFMLDELGNLQSEGKGIAGFETMLSIGLGQEQQFTLILQTLQQLKAVYGDDVDKIVQGNVSNIIFLKSTDDSMIETLEKMSGTRHVSRANSKQITQNLDKVVGGRTDGAISHTFATEEEPLIKFNDMAFISPRNSIVFRAGDAPVWNRNETILPMSWRLLRKNAMVHPGHEYTLQTIPTMSSAIDFDVRSNQPNFREMLNRRMSQSYKSGEAKEKYAEAYGYEEMDIERLDPDVYAEEVMTVVDTLMAIENGTDDDAAGAVLADEDAGTLFMFDPEDVADNLEVQREVAATKADEATRQKLIYAEGMISKEMLVNRDGSARVKSLDFEIGEAYKRAQIELERDSEHFQVGGDGELRSADGSRVYITPSSREHAEAVKALNDAMTDEDSRTFGDEAISDEDARRLGAVQVHAAFYQFLAELPSWAVLGDGAFEREMAVEMKGDQVS